MPIRDVFGFWQGPNEHPRFRIVEFIAFALTVTFLISVPIVGIFSLSTGINLGQLRAICSGADQQPEIRHARGFN
jgi:hypothetical protein